MHPVSLIKETKIWLCFIPKNDNGIPNPELIISPIDFSAWDDLWRIAITLEDKIGVVNEILQTIKENGINILSLETNSINSQNLHQIELIVDARRYSNTPYDKLYYDRKDNLEINQLRDLKRQIIARVVDNIHFVGIKPRIKINRIYGLYDAAYTFTKYQKDYPTHKYLSPKFGTTFVNSTEKKELYPSKITLPKTIRESLISCLTQGKKDKSAKEIKYLPISDTKDRFLRVYFFHKDDKVISFTLQHREIVGAVATITSSISAAHFNILTSHSRVDKFGEKAITDFVVIHPEKDNLTLNELIEKLENALSNKELINVYEVKICYPDKYNSNANFKKLELSDSLVYLKESKETTESRLLLKYQELDENKNDLSEKDKLRLNLLAKLLREENLREPASGKKSVFVSLPFDNSNLTQIVEGMLSNHNLDSVTGWDLSQGDTIREELKNRIENCDFFLGIWTKDKGIKAYNDKWFPSPWLFWEWGIAEGKNKISRLILSKDIENDILQRIASDQPHLNYKHDIKKPLEKAIRYFVSKI